jgi:hypothetical protein
VERTLASLITDVEGRDLALPEFQRDYRWPVEHVEELLRSIGQGFPIGTLLLLNQEDSPKLQLQARAIKGGPTPKSRPSHLLLDGQQRITALYNAYHDLGDQVYLVNLQTTTKKGFTDECLSSQARKALDAIEVRRAAKVITLQEVYSNAHFTAWLSDPIFSDADRTRLAEMREKHLSLFREHTVTCDVVSGKLPIAAIAKVFERTNRRVLTLDAFDLTVAIMWPHGFKLRTKWADAVAANPILSEYGVTGLDILRVIALREHLREKTSKGSGAHLRVQGIRQSDILEIPPATIKRDWDGAVRAFVRALEFTKGECGAIRRRLMPNVTMWIPLADALWKSVPKRGTARHSKLMRWFWTATFSRQYARGANTKAVSDSEALRKWLGPGGREPPDYVKRFRIDETDLSDAADEGNEILIRGLVCLLNTKGARDWTATAGQSPPPRLTDVDIRLAIHHVYPQKFLAQRPSRGASPHAPANQALISSSLNGKLNNQPPEYAVTSTLVDTAALPSHSIEQAWLKGSYTRFVKARAKALAAIVNQAAQ